MRKILIVGGGFDNKGAQAMSFACIDQIKKLKKQYEPILCLERRVTQAERDTYNFSIMEINKLCDLRGNIFFWLLALLKSTKEKRQQYQAFRKVLKETDYVIDISGFQLSSKWALGAVIGYLTRIGFYKKHNIQVLIFPQSFGPLNYSFFLQKFLDFLIKKNLRYPQVIYAREKEGYELLVDKYHLRNVQISPDLVLLHKDIRIENIYHSYCEKEINIAPESVCIIPNIRLQKRISEDDLVSIYKKIIDKLLKNQKNVYLLNHSKEDKALCLRIKECFKENREVRLLLDEVSCLDYCALVKKFDFIIASRYHSIIHAYKEGVPAIILGWAIKYGELAALFGQEKYQVMAGESDNVEQIMELLDKMIIRYKEERSYITEAIGAIQRKYSFARYFNMLDTEE